VDLNCITFLCGLLPNARVFWPGIEYPKIDDQTSLEELNLGERLTENKREKGRKRSGKVKGMRGRGKWGWARGMGDAVLWCCYFYFVRS